MPNRNEMPETAQAFAYEIKGNSAVIWRCFSRDTKALIPEEIGGCPVTEVAPYAFSAHMDERAFEKEVRLGKMHFYIPQIFSDGLPPALCGDALEEIVFPSTVLRVGRYCFYNCSKLGSMEFWGTLFDWGSGVFTGSHNIREMCIHVIPGKTSSFKQVLDEIYEELHVCCIIEPEGMRADLVFPEFFVEGIENTPARILEERIHGTGMMYRNCFQGKDFDFRQYDTLFPHAVVQEPAKAVAHLAAGRLRHPHELSEKAKEQYLAYVQEHEKEMGALILSERDMEGLSWFLSVAGKQEGLLEYMTEQASRLQFTEAMSLLMEFGRTTRPRPARRRLEL